MPFRLCILSIIGLVTFQVGASARTMLEPRVGMEALLNCVLYDPSCLKAPVAALQPSEPGANAAREAVADAKTGTPNDPETTGWVPPRSTPTSKIWPPTRAVVIGCGSVPGPPFYSLTV